MYVQLTVKTLQYDSPEVPALGTVYQLCADSWVLMHFVFEWRVIATVRSKQEVTIKRD
jgi:hypothetical protein